MRRDLTIIVNHALHVVDLLWQSGAMHPVTYVAQQELLQFVGDLELRRSRLHYTQSDSELLAALQ